MRSTQEIYGNPPEKYIDMSYVDALVERYFDAKYERMKLRLCGYVWTDVEYARAKMLTEAMRHNETLIKELNQWSKVEQRESNAWRQTSKILQSQQDMSKSCTSTEGSSQSFLFVGITQRLLMLLKQLGSQLQRLSKAFSVR